MAFAVTFVGEWPDNLKGAGERVLAALQAELNELPSGTVSLKLVDDAEIQAFNEQYNGNAYATDVLTFSYIEDNSFEPLEGELADVIISLETAEKQAKEAGIMVEDEVGLLILHGLLHVLGYDHDTAEGRSTLDDLQPKIMDKAGLKYREFTWDL